VNHRTSRGGTATSRVEEAMARSRAEVEDLERELTR